MNFLLQEQRASAYVLWRAGDLPILFHLFVYSHMNLCLSSRASILFSGPELYTVWFSLLLRLFPLRPPELFEVGFHPLRRALVLLNLVLGTSFSPTLEDAPVSSHASLIAVPDRSFSLGTLLPLSENGI